MSSASSAWLSRALRGWVRLVRRTALAVVAGSLLLAALAVWYTAGNLGVDTDTGDMISAALPWRQTYARYQQAFPQYSDNLVIVIDGRTPELAESAGERLAGRLRAEHDLVEWVYQPGAGKFFEQHALLYPDLDELQALSDNLAAVQPFLARLTADPSLRGLFALISSALDAVRDGAGIDLAPVLARIGDGVAAALEGRFQQVSWREVMLGRPATASEKRRFVIVKPRLDYGELFPAGPVLERVRALESELGLDAAHGVQARITGGVALEYEELVSVSRGAGLAALLALIMVGAVLFAGLRSTRLVAASLLTLVVGLLWTAAFAAAAVGHLNLISVAFAVLYIGLGIAYAIHFCLRYRELVVAGSAAGEALERAAGDVGGSLVLCAVTTGIGFFAFVPTDFAGVSELGLISGTGTFISLAASLTLLPALLELTPLRAPARAAEAGAAPGARALVVPPRTRRAVLGAALLAGAGSLFALPAVRFDANPLNLRDPSAESVRTFRDLMAESDTSPWTAVVVAADAARARALQSRLDALDVVDGTAAVWSFVPADQQAKLALIADLRLLLGPSLVYARDAAAPTPAEQRAALAALRAQLAATVPGLPAGALADAAARLQSLLGRLEQQLAARPGGAGELLARLQRSLIGTLPGELRTLRASLDTGPFGVDDLPPELRRRWVTPDGRYRVEVFPRQDLDQPGALRRFVSRVREVAPRATDSPVVILKSGDAVVGAFQQAFLSALATIALLLLVLLPRRRDVLLVLAPLLLAGLFTLGVMVLVGIPFNFANVIALPLLLGVGVDNGIHMVNRMRVAPPADGNLLRTSTARAVVFSALTTIVSFGNLAFSPHRGTASMGALLSIGLGFTLLCTLILLPVMLARAPPAAAPREAGGS